MAINQNHLSEELNGVKCAIAEKNVAGERVDFLRGVLEYNGFTVVVTASPPPKAAPAPPAGGAALAAVSGPSETTDAAPASPVGGAAPPPETFTVGVTDVMFN